MNTQTIILFGLLNFSTLQLFTQPIEPVNYISTQWGMDEGLPSSSVNDILQSKDGYIWLATFAGLVRFNGQEFTVFNRSNSKTMISDRVINLYEATDSSIWGSTEDGIIRYQNGQFKSYKIYHGETAYSPAHYVEDGHHKLWVVANGQIYRFQQEKFIHVIPSKSSTSRQKALADRTGAWVYHNREIFRSYGDSVAVIWEFGGTVENNISSFVEYPKQSGIYWIATRGEGVLKLENGKFTKYSIKDGLASRFSKQLFIDNQNVLWVVSFNGVSYLSGNKFHALRSLNGKDEQDFFIMNQDREGNFWFGTIGKGLFKLRPTPITTINEKQGLTYKKMLGITQRKNGTLLFATNCDGIYEMSDGKVIRSDLNKDLVNLCTWVVFEDSKERIWIGSRLLQLFDKQKKHVGILGSNDGFIGYDIFSIIEDSKGNIWIGCLNGLFLYDGKEFRRFSKLDGLSSNDVRSIYEDRSGKLWVGTSSGLNMYENGKIQHFQLSESFPDSTISSNEYIRSIYQDDYGAMWFGSYGDGIFRLKNGTISHITVNNGLYDDIVSHLVDDKKGHLWTGSNRGISRLSLVELNAVADGQLKTIRPTIYTKSDGMESSETNGGFQPNHLMDDNGNIYFPSVSGIVVVNTNQVKINSIQPPVKIENIIVNQRLILPNSQLILPHDSTNIEIQIASLSFTEPTKNRFKYQLQNNNDEWIDIGNRRTVFISSINPGVYNFKVIASNNDGIWNEVGDSVSMTILPPYWQSFWFRFWVIIFFIGSGVLIFFLQVNALKIKNKQQVLFAEQLIQSQELERQRIASELHDGLGQQILVIKNRVELALKSIDDPKLMKEQLLEIKSSAISSIEDVRNISHGLRPIHLEQFGLTETLLYLIDQTQQSSPIKWVYHVDQIDGIIPAEKEINLFRILQEGIKNIINHADAKQASMMVRKNDDYLIVSLWDNGKGFDVDAVKKISGLGMKGIFERAKSLHGECVVKSSPGEGTTVKIIIHLKNYEKVK